jgi:drug/metabolite transporter (DMT)-like permease
MWRAQRCAQVSRYHARVSRSSSVHPQSGSTAFGAMTVILTLTGWASVPLFLRHFADAIDPWTSNGWRYGFSALVWLPVLLAAASRGRLPPGLWRAAIVPSIVNAAGQICFTSAHYVIDPGLLTFGLRSQLVFVAIGAWIMFPRERAVIRTPGYLSGAALLVAGMVGVLLLGQGESTVAGSAVGASAHLVRGSAAAHSLGVALAVGSGMLFAAYGLAVRKYMHGVNPVLAFATICQYTAAALVILMLAFGDRAGVNVLRMPTVQIILLLVSALIGIAIGHVFYYISIARLGVAVTAGVLQLQPFLVAIGSMALFGERLTPWQWAGGCIAVTGAMLMLSVQWLISRQVERIEEPVAIAEGEGGG